MGGAGGFLHKIILKEICLSDPWPKPDFLYQRVRDLILYVTHLSVNTIGVYTDTETTTQ